MLGLLTGFTSALQLLDYYTLTLMHLMLPFLVPAAFIFCIFSKEEKEALLSLCLTLIDGSSSNSEPMLTFNDEHTYTKNLFNKKIVILGPTAPPLGGISVHVQRTAAQLRQQKNSVKIFDTTKRSMLQLYDLSKLIFFLLRHRPDHVLYHTHYCGIKQLLAITLLKKIVSYQLMLIDHDCRMLYTQSTSYKKIFSYCQTHIDTTILIGNATLKSYHDNGITFASALIEPAFLAPDLATKSAIMKSYPTSLMQFLAERKPILCMNACQLVLLNNQDLYGVKLTLQALGELKKTNPDVGLIIALAQIGNGSYFQELQQFIQEQNLQDAVCFFGGQKELWPLLAHVDLFLRPTLSDAHSVSICEALYLKTPVLASDAVDRPQECLLFKTGDVGSYVEMLQVALDKRGSYGSIHSSSLHSEEHSPRTEL
jgi:glycosyltransferase involved in cell wall biosynthesis